MPEHSSFHLELLFLLLLVSWKMSDDEFVPLRCTNYHFLAGGVHFFFLSCWHFVVVIFLFFEDDAEPCAV